MSNLGKQVALDLSVIESASDFLRSLQEDTKGFSELAVFLRELAGINLKLDEKNKSLMAGRLSSILRERGMGTYQEYLQVLYTRQPQVLSEFVSALTTNTTEFFREGKHFEVLRGLIPELIRQKRISPQRDLRVWCAAASTGQEPYSILITLLETLPNPESWNIKFLATDIDREVLERAARGRYSEQEIKGVPPIHRSKYFLHHNGSKGSEYIVQPRYRSMIRFAPLNLTATPYPFQHPFDIVFCRNVLIYFEREMASNVIENLAKATGAGGHVFLGHSETGLTRASSLKSISHAVYEKLVK